MDGQVTEGQTDGLMDKWIAVHGKSSMSPDPEEGRQNYIFSCSSSK